jgi:hypothetical protein
MLNSPSAQFNPHAKIEVLTLFEGHQCVVIDDFLLNPQEIVDFAGQGQAGFRYDQDNYFPGLEMDMGRLFALQFEQYFMLKLRPYFHVRRNLGSACRISMTTLQTDQLHPLQRLCHRDAETLPAGMGIGASVVYLFDRPELGGTSFFQPAQGLDQVSDLLQLAAQGDNALLTEQIQQAASYCHQSNPWFELKHTIEAKWNRAIFYEGTVFHAAHIRDATLLSEQVAQSRLCLNAFFRFKKQASWNSISAYA